MHSFVLFSVFLLVIFAGASAQVLQGTASYSNTGCTGTPYFLNFKFVSTCSQTTCSSSSAVVCRAGTEITSITIDQVNAAQVLAFNYYTDNVTACHNDLTITPLYATVYPIGKQYCGPIESQFTPTGEGFSYGYVASCTDFQFCKDSGCSQCETRTVNNTIPTCFGWYGGPVLAQCFAPGASVTTTTTGLIPGTTTTTTTGVPAGTTTSNGTTTSKLSTSSTGSTGSGPNTGSSTTTTTSGAAFVFASAIVLIAVLNALL